MEICLQYDGCMCSNCRPKHCLKCEAKLSNGEEYLSCKCQCHTREADG